MTIQFHSFVDVVNFIQSLQLSASASFNTIAATKTKNDNSWIVTLS